MLAFLFDITENDMSIFWASAGGLITDFKPILIAFGAVGVALLAVFGFMKIIKH